MRAAISLTGLLLTGCAAFTPPASHHALEADTPQWFQYSADRRGAVLIRWRNGSMHFCAEPAPDVALRQAIDLAAKAQTPQNITVEAQAKFSTDVLQLAGRTQAILFQREALYRICEAQMNGALREDQVAPLVQQVLQTTATIAAAQFVNEISKTPDDKLPAVADALRAVPPVVSSDAVTQPAPASSAP
jgi:hypothetical protein